MAKPATEITREMCEKAAELASLETTMSEIAISLNQGGGMNDEFDCESKIGCINN